MSGPAPVARLRFRTSDVDEATQYQRGYASFHAEPISDRSFEFTVDAASTGAFEIASLEHTGRTRALIDPLRVLMVVEVHKGSMWYSTPHEDAGGELAVAPTWSPAAVGWEGVDLRMTTVDLTEVARTGAEVSGLDARAVTFRRMAPISAAHGRYWRRLVDHVERNLLAHDELMAEPLIRRAALDQLARGALTVFPNATLEQRHSNGRDSGEPATVRRAVEFIDANAQRDIDITQVAEASGLGVRGLQSAFRKHRDQSPTQYLRRVRMEGARRDLVAGDPTLGHSVAAIAARWGFTHPGRFSAEYRRAYGCTPSETLRR